MIKKTILVIGTCLLLYICLYGISRKSGLINVSYRNRQPVGQLSGSYSDRINSIVGSIVYPCVMMEESLYSKDFPGKEDFGACSNRVITVERCPIGVYGGNFSLFTDKMLNEYSWNSIGVSGYWNPTDNDIERAMRTIKSTVLYGMVKYDSKNIPPWAGSFKKYTSILGDNFYAIQAYGIYHGMNKRIFFNFGGVNMGMDRATDVDRWVRSKDFRIVNDGGVYYVRIEYDMIDECIYNFDINGEA